MQLEQQIEAVLFYKAKSVSIPFLLKFFAVDENELGSALASLQQSLSNRGVQLLVCDNQEIQLVTAPECAATIEQLRKDDQKKDIGTAGAETLAVVLYRGPISRAEIDRIRGVNSSFILRNLMIRGLVERAGTGEGSGYRYQVTPSLLAHLGITQKEQLPDFVDISSALAEFETNSQTEEPTP